MDILIEKCKIYQEKVKKDKERIDKLISDFEKTKMI